MTFYLGAIVYCPVYFHHPQAGTKIGCGSADVVRHGRTGPLAYECRSCGAGFGPGNIEYDRKVQGDTSLKAAHDACIVGGRYLKAPAYGRLD
jgi:hypothetical protein